MGGKVFSKGVAPLNTPRMRRPVYDFVKLECHHALSKLKFSRVATPIETPEKNDFGDIDILVCLEGEHVPLPPKAAEFDDSHWERVEKSLGAERSVACHTIGPNKQRIVDSKSFAIHWPPLFASDPAGLKKQPGAKPSPRYVQVDVRLCDTQEELEWRLYKHNHGDLWNMVGQTIRPFGLTADEVGLHIRIPEIEKQDKKKARVLLTSDPSEANDFLGLTWPSGDWKKEFNSIKDLFECAASCRWFMLWPEDHNEDPRDGSDKENQNPLKKTREETQKGQRPVFARWIDEFKPACRAQGRFMVLNPEERTRETVRGEVRERAFRTFPASKAEYDARLTEWDKEKTRIYVKNTLIKKKAYLPEDIKPYLPAPRDRDGDTDGDKNARLVAIETQWRSVLVSALQKIVVDDDDSFEGVVPPKLRDDKGVLDVDEVKDWIEKNWPEVGRVAWRRQCDRAKEHIDRKAAEDAGRTGDVDTTHAATDKK